MNAVLAKRLTELRLPKLPEVVELMKEAEQGKYLIVLIRRRGRPTRLLLFDPVPESVFIAYHGESVHL